MENQPYDENLLTSDIHIMVTYGQPEYWHISPSN